MQSKYGRTSTSRRTEAKDAGKKHGQSTWRATIGLQQTHGSQPTWQPRRSLHHEGARARFIGPQRRPHTDTTQSTTFTITQRTTKQSNDEQDDDDDDGKDYSNLENNAKDGDGDASTASQSVAIEDLTSNELYEEYKETELEQRVNERENISEQRSGLQDELQLLHVHQQDMHAELELINDPAVAHHAPERREQGRERLADAILNSSLAEDCGEVQEDIDRADRALERVDLEIERVVQDEYHSGSGAEYEAADDTADRYDDEEEADEHGEEDDSTWGNGTEQWSSANSEYYGEDEGEDQDIDVNCDEDEGAYESSQGHNEERGDSRW